VNSIGQNESDNQSYIFPQLKYLVCTVALSLTFFYRWKYFSIIRPFKLKVIVSYASPFVEYYSIENLVSMQIKQVKFLNSLYNNMTTLLF